MPLETIGFGWRSHLAALHWLGLLYRRPAQVQARWRNMPRIVALRSGLFLLLHAQVYVILWRVLLFLMLGDHRLDALDLASGIAFGIAATRAYYLPWHFAMIWPVAQEQYYRWHPVAWDDLCGVPFPGLERLLVAFAKQDRTAGEVEIERLIDTYPAQQRPALLARIVLLAKDMAAQPDLAQLDTIASRLPAGPDKVLADIPRLQRGIAGIAQRQRVLDTAAHGFLREPLAQALWGDIERFRDQAAGLTRPVGPAFRDAAAQWLNHAERQWNQAHSVMEREPAPQVFRSGNPIDRAKEAFTPRLGIVGELSSQLALASRCPALILYGRRRTGKSTILRNLDFFLPASVRVVRIDMLNPSATESLSLLIGWIGAEIDTAIGDDMVSPAESGLDGLARLLDAAEARLGKADRRLLLTIDEVERLDAKIGHGKIPEALLAVLRHSIQTHRRITWMLAGSHDIGELRHAPWASYLINARTILVPMFTLQETRLLLTEPMKASPFWDQKPAERPRFDAGFWGEGGIERIHAETGGWPDLVQWVAEATIDLLNQTSARSVDAALLEQAFVRVVERATTTLMELIEFESLLQGEFAYLQGFRQSETQPPPTDPAVARSLRRRMLLADADGGQYRLRVPLMRRWLIANG